MPFTVLKEALEPLLPPILVAVFGGIARFCLGNVHTVRQFISGLIVSAFSGLIAALLLADAPLSLYTKFALGGMAGYMGGWFLDAVAKRLARSVATAPVSWDGTERRGADVPPERKE